MSAALSLAPAEPGEAACAHCGLPAPRGAAFCCPGCAAARDMIETLGLGRYYQERILDPAVRAPKPGAEAGFNLAGAVEQRDDGCALTLAIDGLHCGACVWLIEHVLARESQLTQGRVNLTTRRLTLSWSGSPDLATHFVGIVEQLGYRLVPYTQAALAASSDAVERRLLRALAVAGFAAGNVMLISVGIWAGKGQGMGHATRDLLHWVSALIAMPAIAYAGRVFFASAWRVLRRGRTNMDVPISVGVLLVTAMSLVETCRGGTHTYFDSASALLFFLLIGRWLDHRGRSRARATVEQLLMLRTSEVVVLEADGTAQPRRPGQVPVGARVLVALGERVGVDGVVVEGSSVLDTSLVTGESVPRTASTGTPVHAGTLNLGAPLVLRVTATGDDTLLAECARLIDAAERRKSRFILLTDRIARAYTPVVHIAALATFLLWRFGLHADTERALLTAAAVLIITCPCALALAVPAVQVTATSRLFRSGIWLRSPTALERLAQVDTVVFDKTGTLTEPGLDLEAVPDRATLAQACALAASSRHPLARALLRACDEPVPVITGARELPGQGIEWITPGGTMRLGSPAFCGVAAAPETGSPSLLFTRPGRPAACFAFSERLRADAAATIAALRRRGLGVALLSGDRSGAVARQAAALGIADWRADCLPADKVAAIEARIAGGARVLMVGDGLNDGPSLAAATVSASPATAAELSQNVADVVFQGEGLGAVARVLAVARRARRAMRQNVALAIAYNTALVPLAVAGFVTPWVAALAMSTSSLLVMGNSLRLSDGNAP